MLSGRRYILFKAWLDIGEVRRVCFRRLLQVYPPPQPAAKYFPWLREPSFPAVPFQVARQLRPEVTWAIQTASREISGG